MCDGTGQKNLSEYFLKAFNCLSRKVAPRHSFTSFEFVALFFVSNISDFIDEAFQSSKSLQRFETNFIKTRGYQIFFWIHRLP